MTIEEAGITEADIVYQLLLNGKIDIATAIRFHMKELTLKQIVEGIKNSGVSL